MDTTCSKARALLSDAVSVEGKDVSGRYLQHPPNIATNVVIMTWNSNSAALQLCYGQPPEGCAGIQKPGHASYFPSPRLFSFLHIDPLAYFLPLRVRFIFVL
jgi:hypothetical protein